MEPHFQTSFIPKRPIGSTQSSVSDAIHNVNIFSVIATVVFLVTIITSGGLYALKRVLIGQVLSANTQITEDKAAFEPDKIKELAVTDARLKIAEKILDKHVTPSKVITLFNDLALKRMRYITFGYSMKIGGAPSVSISGEVPSYNAVVEQQRVFSESDFLVNPTLNSFNLGDSGKVSVNFVMGVDPKLVSYKENVQPVSINQ